MKLSAPRGCVSKRRYIQKNRHAHTRAYTHTEREREREREITVLLQSIIIWDYLCSPFSQSIKKKPFRKQVKHLLTSINKHRLTSSSVWCQTSQTEYYHVVTVYGSALKTYYFTVLVVGAREYEGMFGRKTKLKVTITPPCVCVCVCERERERESGKTKSWLLWHRRNGIRCRDVRLSIAGVVSR